MNKLKEKSYTFLKMILAINICLIVSAFAATPMIAFRDQVAEINLKTNRYQVLFSGKAAFYWIKSKSDTLPCLLKSIKDKSSVVIEANGLTMEVFNCKPS
jgi:hypothetical protein